MTNNDKREFPANAPDEFVQWCRTFGDSPGPRQHPADELLAEHHLMRAYLAVMEAEARNLNSGAPFRAALWDGVLAFTGRFVVLSHRGKEEHHFFPALQACGLLGDREREILRNDHNVAAKITGALNNGFETGDWEKVARAVSQYLHFMVPHMNEEEATMRRARAELPEESVVALRHEFNEIESRVLDDWSRWRYHDVGTELCAAVEIEFPFGAD